MALPTQAQKTTGDLDALLKGRTIRAVVPFSKTHFYVLKGVERGISYEGGKAFEEYINRKYTPEKKHLRVHVVFQPVPRSYVSNIYKYYITYKLVAEREANVRRFGNP